MVSVPEDETMPQNRKNLGHMTWNQSAILWCAVVWRSALVGCIPVVTLLIVVNVFVPGVAWAAYVPFLVFIPIIITVQRYVINRINLTGLDCEFSLEVTCKKSPASLLWEDRQNIRPRLSRYTDEPTYQLNRLA